MITGPSCSPCTVPNNVLTSKNTGQIVGPVTLSNPGTFTIQVQNGTGSTLSNGQTVVANAAGPTTSLVSPTTAVASTSLFTVTVNGSGFDPATAQMVFVGPSCLTSNPCVVGNGVLTTKNTGQVAGPVRLINAGSFTVQVQNGSGGTLSNAQSLTVNAPTTTLTSPTTVTASASSFSMTINGSNFDPATAQIVITGPSCSPCTVPNNVLTSKNTGQIVGPVTLSNPGTFTIQVQNGAGSTLSNGQTVTAH